jgi:RNA polymerase sigma-70 factor (ECF subfamily)
MDEQTVIRAQHGDRDAFAALIESVGDRLHAISQGLLRDRSLAEDATQQTLLQIWRDLPQLRAPAAFEACCRAASGRTPGAEAP